MNSFIVAVLFMSIALVSALPAPQAPAAAGPFTTMFQTAGGVAAASFADAAKFASIFPAAADTALGVSQTVFGRFVGALNGYAAGK